MNRKIAVFEYILKPQWIGHKLSPGFGRIMAANSFSLFSFGVSIAIIGPVIEDIQSSLSVSSSDIGLLFTFFSLGFLLSVLFIHFFGRRYGMAEIGLVGQLILCLSLIAFSFSPSLSLALLFYGGVGMGGGAIQIATNAIVSTQSSLRRSQAMSLLHLCFGLGALIGPLLAAMMLGAKKSWHWAYWFNAVLAAFALALLWLASGALQPKRMNNPLSLREKDNSRLYDIRLEEKLFGHQFIWILGLCILCYVGVEMAVNSWAVVYLQSELGMDKLNASSRVSYFWAAMTFGRLLTAYAGKYISAVLMLVILSLAALMAYIALLAYPLASTMLMIILGLAFSGLFPLYLSLAGDRYPQSIALITTFAMIFLALGFMIFPWLVGFIKNYSNIVDAMYWLMIPLGVIVVGAGYLFVVNLRKKTFISNGACPKIS